MYPHIFRGNYPWFFPWAFEHLLVFFGAVVQLIPSKSFDWVQHQASNQANHDDDDDSRCDNFGNSQEKSVAAAVCVCVCALTVKLKQATVI